MKDLQLVRKVNNKAAAIDSAPETYGPGMAHLESALLLVSVNWIALLFADAAAAHTEKENEKEKDSRAAQFSHLLILSCRAPLQFETRPQVGLFYH